MELLDRISRTAHDTPTRLAYVQADGTAMSYAQLQAAIEAAARALRESGSSSAIILNCGNRIEFAVRFLAALRAGVDVLAISDATPAAEVERLTARLNRSPIAKTHGDLLLPTSGSTGTPKIVRRDAASIDAVSANMVEAIEFRPGDRVLAAVPLAHSYGIEHGLFAPLWAGATVHLFNGLDLDAIDAAREPFDIFPAVPSMFERLADANPSMRSLRNLRAVYSAGAPLPEPVRERFIARFGRPVGQLYGATEIGTVTYRAGDARPDGARPGDVGWPMRGVSIRVLDTGEIAIQSPSMFNGYLDEPADLIDGHFLPGDLGHLTADGALALTGRSKLLIDVGGLKVNPLEVEAAIASHAAVAECVVVPIVQSETVERLRAIIVPREPASPPAVESLRSHARQLLAAHKVPRVFEIRPTPLPRSAAGKVLRTAVIES